MRKVVKRIVDFSKLEKVYDFDPPSVKNILPPENDIMVWRSVNEIPEQFVPSFKYLGINQNNFKSLTIKRGVSLTEAIHEGGGNTIFLTTGPEEFSFANLGNYSPEPNKWFSLIFPLKIQRSGREFFPSKPKKGFIQKNVRCVPNKQYVVIIEFN